jgi:hypothetical protein
MQITLPVCHRISDGQTLSIVCGVASFGIVQLATVVSDDLGTIMLPLGKYRSDRIFARICV